MKRFEYKRITVNIVTENIDKILSVMGAEGWELKSVERNNFYFMREYIPEPSKPQKKEVKSKIKRK